MRILVTGGTGTLGRRFVAAATAAGHTVRIMSRHARESDAPRGVEWAQADLADGRGLEIAVIGVDAVLHAATRPGFGSREVDVHGTERLLNAARRAGVRHVVYPSIVGIDDVPLRYYRLKREAEQVVRRGGVPWSIVRITQFHELLDRLIAAAARLPVLPLPTDFQFQPVAARNAAERLVDRIGRDPAGRAPDFGGPEVRRLGELAADWLDARGKDRPIVRLPVPGRTARALRRGELTSPDGPRGGVRWRDWLGRA